MTTSELDTAVTYFKSIKSKCLIEVEVKESNASSFEAKYALYKHCSDIDYKHFHKIPDNGKWGVELRVYYNEDNSTPQFIKDLSTKQNRAGFEQFNKRLNNNELIYKLFENGFCIGQN